MMRLIDADKLTEEFEKLLEKSESLIDTVFLTGTLAIIDNQPTAQQWISVKDELPKEYERVLAAFEDEFISAADFINGEFELWANSGDVTHWMPLPEPPKEELA